MRAHPLIVYAGGFWSTNIGNAFFDLGCIHLLKTASPDARVVFTTEQPGNFWSVEGANPENSIDYLGSIKADYIAVAGTVLSKGFSLLWKRTLEKMRSNGSKLILVSVGCSQYDEEEVARVRAFLREFVPHAIVSRDTYTYEHFGDLAPFSYDGICGTFFIPDYFQPYQLTTSNNYVIFNFDKILEPVFSEEGRFTKKFGFAGKEWSYSYSKRNRILQEIQLRKEILFPKFQKLMGNFEIIRTRNSAYPIPLRRLFRAPNSFASDIPYDYLNLYANSKGVFSDRVHTCAAALALGKPAMLFSDTPRAKLIERVGLQNINVNPVILDKEYINKEKTKLVDFMRGILSI